MVTGFGRAKRAVLITALNAAFVHAANLDAATPLILRRTWNDRSNLGPTAHAMLASQQSNCLKRQGAYSMEQYGMGQNLHRWSLALCYAMSKKVALVPTGGWVWEDEAVCTNHERSQPLSCYFGPLGCEAKLATKAWPGWDFEMRLLRHPATLGCKVIYDRCVPY